MTQNKKNATTVWALAVTSFLWGFMVFPAHIVTKSPAECKHNAGPTVFLGSIASEAQSRVNLCFVVSPCLSIVCRHRQAYYIILFAFLTAAATSHCYSFLI